MKANTLTKRPAPTQITMIVSNPTVPEAKKITKEDVWGGIGQNGMIVARTDDKCPYFKDKVPYKSVTVVCDKDQVHEVTYWLEYVHGAHSVSKTKDLKNGKVAMRSDYKCW